MSAPPANPIQRKNNFIPDIDKKIDHALKFGPPIKVENQEWALIIVLGPEGCPQRNVKYVMSILGVFETREEADNHAKELHEAGYIWFDIHLVPLYKLLPFPPCTRPDQVKYFEKEMGQIMDGYRNQEQYAQKALQDRLVFDRAEEERRIELMKKQHDDAKKELAGIVPETESKTAVVDESHLIDTKVDQ